MSTELIAFAAFLFGIVVGLCISAALAYRAMCKF